MIDLHCHILPGIDDGAVDWESAINMARIAENNSIDKIVTTPHISYRYNKVNKDLIEKKIEEANKIFNMNNIKVDLYAGAEILLSDEILDFKKNDKLVTINNSKYLLIEFPTDSIPVYAKNTIYNLRMMGITPIISHPERNTIVIRNSEIIEDFFYSGCCIQVNSGSLVGEFGSKSKKIAWKFLKNSLVSFIASDAHSDKNRKPELKRVFKIVSKKLGEEVAEDIFKKNPLKVLNNEDIF